MRYRVFLERAKGFESVTQLFFVSKSNILSKLYCNCIAALYYQINEFVRYPRTKKIIS